MTDRLIHGTYSCSQVCCDGRDGGACDVCKQAGADYMRAYRRNNPDKYAREKDRSKKLSRAKTVLASRHQAELTAILKELDG